MRTPRRRIPGLALSLVFATACTQDASDPGVEDRLAVVFVGPSGVTQLVGTYDAETGELAFVPAAQGDMARRIRDAGLRATVDAADVDLDAGVVVIDDGIDGDSLELIVDGPAIGTVVIGRLELRAETTWRGNKVWQDDWLAPV